MKDYKESVYLITWQYLSFITIIRNVIILELIRKACNKNIYMIKLIKLLC